MTHFVLSFALAASAHAQSFPLPVSAERAVSDVIRTAAAGNQSNPRIATNGDLALVAWEDTRGNPAIYAARVDSEGNALDPLGVRIGEGLALNAVAWNGESFVVVMGATFAFVSPDMTVTIRHVDLQPGYSFAAATTGPDVRFLFISSGSEGGNSAVVDDRGEVVARKSLWTDPPNGSSGAWVAGANEAGFLLLRNVSGMGAGTRMIADRIDRAGNILSSRDSGLPIDAIEPSDAIAGGDDGFLLIHQNRLLQDVTGYRLDPAGVFGGQAHVLAQTDPAARHGGVHVVREANRYLVVWHTNLTSGHSYESVAEVRLDGAITVGRMVDWAGITRAMAVTSNQGRRLVATSVNRTDSFSEADVFVHAVSELLQPAEPALVTAAAMPQTSVDVAAGANGYAVTWAEHGLDGLWHTYVRRFSPTGTPQDEDPIHLLTSPDKPTHATIVSNGDTYLLGWQTSAGYFIRRLEARSGNWIDAEPIALGIDATAVDLASNGTDAIAFASGARCDDSSGCIASRRIALTGAPLSSPVVSRKAVKVGFLVEAVVASNGSDYLAVWTELPACQICFGPFPAQVYAIRLRPDGTAIDAEPMRLDTGERLASRVAVGSAEGRALVAWFGPDGVRGTRITAEGAVLDRDEHGGGVLLARPASGYTVVLTPVIAGVGTHFGLVIRQELRASQSAPLSVTLEGVMFDAQADLNAVAAMPRTVLLTAGDHRATFAAAARGSTLAVAYDRIAMEGGGGVPRAFVRLFAETAPRRRAAGR